MKSVATHLSSAGLSSFFFMNFKQGVKRSLMHPSIISGQGLKRTFTS